MVKTILIVIMVALSTHHTWAQRPEGSETAPRVRIAVLDTNYIMHEANVAKQLLDELEKRRTRYENDALKAEEELRQLHKQLQENQKNLSAQELSQNRRDFEQKVMKFQQHVQDQKNKLNYGRAKGMELIEKKLQDIVEILCREQGLDLVLPAAVVIYGKSQYDITQPVLAELNRQLMSLDIEKICKDYIQEGFGKIEDAEQ